MPAAKITSQTVSTINLAKTPYAALAKKVPTNVNKTLVFDIHDGNCAIANAIRRTLISEMPMKHLTVSLTDIHSSDPYIIGDVIRKRLEMIPIAQTIDPDSVFSLRIENSTDGLIDVMSSDIKLNGEATSKDIIDMIPICDINSGKSFSINDIHVVTSYGFDNSRPTPGRVGYEILDQDFSEPHAIAKPTHFRLTLETPGILDPVDIVGKAIKCLIERLDAIDYTKAITEFDVYKLTIANETHSMRNLITWYTYNLEPSIGYVASRMMHPSKRECIIDVRHPAGEELCKKAVAAIKKDLADIAKAFK